MTAIVKDLSIDSLDNHPCFKCGGSTERTIAMTKDWLRKVYSKFGPCVKVVYFDNRPVAMVQYAPMDIFPHVSQNSAHRTIIVHCVYVLDKDLRGKGIGRMLMEALISDLKKPHLYLKGGKFERIEAVAGEGRPGPAGPVGFFTKLGFKIMKRLGNNDVLVRLQL